MNELELLQTFLQFLQDYKQMRDAQKIYFREHSKEALIRSKDFERHLDGELFKNVQALQDLIFVQIEHQKNIENLLS